MATAAVQSLIKQLALFTEPPQIPAWEDQTPQARAQVLRLLAHLLVQVRARGRGANPRSQGGDHE